jgi:transcriptional regulator with XRE-family HTH domain
VSLLAGISAANALETCYDVTRMATATNTSIRALRQRLRITQIELAERAGVHRITVGRFERGYVPERGSSLVKVANALGVSVADLVPDGGSYPEVTPDARITPEAPQRHSRAA